MASSIKKHTAGGQTYWRFCFTSARKQRQGFPRQKDFYFSADRFKKSDVERIRDQYEFLYRAGKWDPWTQAPEEMLSDPAAPEVIQLSKAIDQYAKHLPIELAPATVKMHIYVLRMMDTNLGRPDVRPLSDDPAPINHFLNQYDNYKTKKDYRYIIKRFFTWMHEQEMVDQVPDLRIYGREEKKEKDHLTFSEFQQYMAALDSVLSENIKASNTPVSSVQDSIQRVKDASAVMFFMGLRISDMLHCRPAWILEDFTLLRIGDLDRWGLKDSYTPKSQMETDPPIAIPPEVEEIFRRRKAMCTGMYQRLFGFRSASWVQKRVKAGMEKAFGKERAKGLSPHSLRHSCASYWVNERGKAIHEVQRLLRHADMKMTAHYHHHDKEAHLRTFRAAGMRKL